MRGWAKGTLPTYQDRKVFFESIVNGEPEPVELLRTGDERAVCDLIAARSAAPSQTCSRGSAALKAVSAYRWALRRPNIG